MHKSRSINLYKYNKKNDPREFCVDIMGEKAYYHLNKGKTLNITFDQIKEEEGIG